MLKTKLKNYCEKTEGAVAIGFSIGAILLILMVSVAIEWSQLVNQRTKLQGYADAAVLAAAASGKTEQADLEDIAESLVNYLAQGPLPTTLSFVDGDLSKIRVSISSEHRPLMMDAFGYDSFNVGALAEAQLSTGTKLNVALVLDTTRSMQGDRMDTLKMAGANLVDRLEEISSETGDVNISVVPFAEYVRIDPSNDMQPWIEVQEDQVINTTVFDSENSSGCEFRFVNERFVRECDVTVRRNVVTTHTWVGCMASRRDGFHKIPEFANRRLQGPAGRIACTESYNIMMPLSSSFDDVKDMIQDLDTTGQTYIPAGLTWGWRTLDPEMPFTEASSFDASERQNVMVVMSDGSNTAHIRGTRSGFNGIYHTENGGTELATQNANELTEELCEGIKADGIKIIAVAFEIDDPVTLELFRNCASGAQNYYNAENGAALEASFEKIADELSNVRLSR